MLNRDFTKSNKEYFKKNRIALICVSLFLVLGIIIGCVFGFNGNFEINGYNEFSVKIGTEYSYTTYQKEIKNIVNSYGANCDTVSVSDIGEDTAIVVRYMKNLSSEKQTKINAEIADKFASKGVELSDISEHTHINAVVTQKDYIYTATAILIILVVATIFAYARYNGASAITVILSSIIGTLGFMSLSTILRLQVGMSYFAMLVMLNMLIIYGCLNLFEHIRETSWLNNRDYANAIKAGMKNSKFRTIALSLFVLVLGLLFVAMAPVAIKMVSLNLMFMAVVLLGVNLYVTPFIWSVLITSSRVRTVNLKVESKEGTQVEE